MPLPTGAAEAWWSLWGRLHAYCQKSCQEVTPWPPASVLWVPQRKVGWCRGKGSTKAMLPVTVTKRGKVNVRKASRCSSRSSYVNPGLAPLHRQCTLCIRKRRLGMFLPAENQESCLRWGYVLLIHGLSRPCEAACQIFKTAGLPFSALCRMWTRNHHRYKAVWLHLQTAQHTLHQVSGSCPR